MAIRLQSTSSIDFLKALFGDHNSWADKSLWVCGFEEPPSPSASWAGNKLNGPSSYPSSDQNGYYSVAAFAADAQGRRVQFIREALAVVLDDMNIEGFASMGVTPSYILETSPGSNQVGFVVKDRENIDGFIKLHKALGQANLLPNDKSGNNAVRYVRLPGCINNKPSTLAKNLGQPFITRLIAFHPEQKFSIAELASAFGVNLDHIHDETVSIDDRSDKELWALIEAADTFHDPLLKIVARLVARGMDAEEIYNAMIGKIDDLIDKIPSDRRERLKDERRDLKRSIKGAIEMYGDRSRKSDVDISEFLNKIADLPPLSEEAIDYPLPPGRLGELALSFLNVSLKPVKEISIAASLTYAAGLIGRRFRTNHLGLNLYLMVLANTGVGKEDGPTAVNEFSNAVALRNLAAGTQLITGNFRSAQGLIKALSDMTDPCGYIFIDEAGLKVKKWATAKNSNDQDIGTILLELFTKSGRGQILSGAAYSDIAKNTQTLVSPAVTICGFTTPDPFYEIISSTALEQGLPSRFVIIKTDAEAKKVRIGVKTVFPEPLVDWFASLHTIINSMSANNTFCDVEISPEAAVLLSDYEDECLKVINSRERIKSQMATRHHAKALKLAGICAVCDDPHYPIVKVEHAAWAIAFMSASDEALKRDSEQGVLATGDDARQKKVVALIRELMRTKKGKGAHTTELLKKGVIPLQAFNERLKTLPVFANHYAGGSTAVQLTLTTMVYEGLLIEVEGQKRIDLNLYGKTRAFIPTFNL